MAPEGAPQCAAVRMAVLFVYGSVYRFHVNCRPRPSRRKTGPGRPEPRPQETCIKDVGGFPGEVSPPEALRRGLLAEEGLAVGSLAVDRGDADALADRLQDREALADESGGDLAEAVRAVEHGDAGAVQPGGRLLD